MPVEHLQAKKSGRIAIMLCTLVFVLAVLATVAARHFHAASKLQVFEAGVQGTPVEWPELDGSPLIVLIGDSRLARWSPRLEVPGFTIANRALGGDTTTGVLQRFQSETWPARPAVIIIQVGVNDLVAAGLNPDRSAEIKVKTIENLRNLVIAAEQVGDRVIIMTIIEPTDVRMVRWPFWSMQIPLLVGEVNQSIRKFAYPKTRMLEANAALKNGDGTWKPGMTVDELHLSAAGYAELRTAILPLVQQN